MRLQSHPDYSKAKAGCIQSACALVKTLISDELIADLRHHYGRDVEFIAPIAMEMNGTNAIPKALAVYFSKLTGGTVTQGVLQVNKTFHTGANAMERLIARPLFRGKISRGQKYVIVDDVLTMGGTTAELANFIQEGQGIVAGVVVIANASRSLKLIASPMQVRELEKRHASAIEDLLGIHPRALTFEEANYLIGFRTTDELRNRAIRATGERHARISSKHVRWDNARDPGSKINIHAASRLFSSICCRMREIISRHEDQAPLPIFTPRSPKAQPEPDSPSDR